MPQFTIGKLAKATGVSAETLRYYEKIKLFKAEHRTPAGYRLYSPDAVRVIRFIRGAQMLHFTLEEIKTLLTLEASDRATCAEMVKHTEAKIAAAETKIAELLEIKKVLTRLLKACPGDDTSIKACPILDHIKHKVMLLAPLVALAGILAAMPQQAEAKPISYVGGTMTMQENDETGHTLSVDYTLTPNYAIGLYAKEERNGKHYTTVGPQWNTLIKRWNLPDGQANIFNSSGIGVAQFHGDNHAAVWTNFLADYETRRVFTSYEVRVADAAGIEKSFWQRARVGTAPYLANYDDVSTWLMLQIDDHPQKDHTIVVTPLVRCFYHTTLVEAGVSNRGTVMFNWWLQF